MIDLTNIENSLKWLKIIVFALIGLVVILLITLFFAWRNPVKLESDDKIVNYLKTIMARQDTILEVQNYQKNLVYQLEDIRASFDSSNKANLNQYQAINKNLMKNEKAWNDTKKAIQAIDYNNSPAPVVLDKLGSIGR